MLGVVKCENEDSEKKRRSEKGGDGRWGIGVKGRFGSRRNESVTFLWEEKLIDDDVVSVDAV